MLKQTLAQKLQQKLSPQQIQLMKLVQLPTQSLEARIKQEIEENPALLEGRDKSEDTFDSDVTTDTDEREVRDSLEEVNWDDYLGDEDTPDYRTKSNNYSSDDELYEAPVVVNESFHESLVSQLNLRDLKDEDLALAVYLVGAIDDDGKTVRAMDILFPGIGEIVGGSQREERHDVLKEKVAAVGIPEEELWWYLETRKFGTCVHSGFGLGFERLVQFCTGMGNIRDVIPFPRTPGSANF